MSTISFNSEYVLWKEASKRVAITLEEIFACLKHKERARILIRFQFVPCTHAASKKYKTVYITESTHFENGIITYFKPFALSSIRQKKTKFKIIWCNFKNSTIWGIHVFVEALVTGVHFRQFLLKSNLFWGTREENRLHSCTGFKGYIVDKASDLWAHSPYALNTLSSTVGIFWKRPIKNILTSVCRLWRVSYSFFWSTYLSSERSTRMDQNKKTESVQYI